MDFIKLKSKFEKELGIVDYKLSDNEMIQINEKIEDIHPENITVDILQEAISDVTGIDTSRLFKADLDNSDIDDMIGQIKDIIISHKK